MRRPREAQLWISLAPQALGTGPVMLFDSWEPPLVQIHTWVRTSRGRGLREPCVLPTHSVLRAPQPLHPLTLVFITQAVFTLLLGPFTFFDVQKTKYLQILTSLMRWIGESRKHLASLPFLPSSLP